MRSILQKIKAIFHSPRTCCFVAKLWKLCMRFKNKIITYNRLENIDRWNYTDGFYNIISVSHARL